MVPAGWGTIGPPPNPDRICTGVAPLSQRDDSEAFLVGVDVGGTFTDVLALDPRLGEIVATVKLPSTPSAPDQGAVEGVDRFLATGRPALGFVSHGTTVGTNTLIEKSGARTALIATRGFRDVLALRRQARPRLYDLQAKVSAPLVPAPWRFEVNERMAYDGQVIVPLDQSEVDTLVNRLSEQRVDAVVIALLHAYANPAHELAIEAAVRAALPDLFVSRSSDVCPEFREFERTSTAAVNAYIGPAVASYFGRLSQSMAHRGAPGLGVVKSNGGVASVHNASRYPVHLIESGPAAGVIATAALGREQGLDQLIAFDMGGTTAKVGVVQDGEPRLSTEFYADRFVDGEDLGGYPIQSPVIDLIEIGAGGGSIAWIDPGGVLRVGPQSSGAAPGPACYGKGGGRPTVTDAHVVLGHIAADGFGSEDVTLDAALAVQAIEREIARPMGWTTERAAWSILRIATANMAEMVRLATLRRGLDPRDFSLVAFGGGGGLHAGEIAREVGIGQVLIPPVPGLFSAVGTVLGDLRHDLVQTVLSPVAALARQDLERVFAQLEARARELIAQEDEAAGSRGWQMDQLLDLRFERQLFELTLPVELSTPGEVAGSIETAFRQAYQASYGYDLPGHPVEVVNARLVSRFARWERGWPKLGASSLAPPSSDGGSEVRQRPIRDGQGAETETTIYPRSHLPADEPVPGPLIVEDFGATIRVLAGQSVTAKSNGILVIEQEDGK